MSSNNSRNDANGNNNNNNNEPLMDKMKRMGGNCFQSTGLCCFKFKEQSQIQVLDLKLTNRQKKFGVDYLSLVQDKAPQSQLKKCLQDALRDISEIQNEINEHHDKIDGKTDEVTSKIKYAPGQEPPPASSSSSSSSPSKKNHKRQNNNTTNSNTYANADDFVVENDDDDAIVATTNNGGGGKKKGGKGGPGSGGSSTNNNKKPKSNRPGGGAGSSSNRPGKKAAAGAAAAAGNSKLKSTTDDDIPEDFQGADPSKWKCKEMKFAGSAAYEEKGKEEKVKGTPIPEGIQHFKDNPSKYQAMMYQSDMVDWPGNQHEFMYLHRKGTIKWKPQGVSPSGWMTVFVNEYERLPRFKDNVLPKSHRDKYTDNMTFCGKKLHTSKNKPIMPGRGMGFGDAPALKIIGDVDPADIFQGSVGDCWLLSGISSVAEFDGAIKKLFRKTKNLDQMPFSDGSINKYTITLWDLKTWKEVDIVIDERLPASPDGSGNLLASKPSEDGELWAPYLEKVLSIHCGGWDKIVGGQCTHAWSMLTGCKHQYTIFKNKATGKYGCYAKLNPLTKKWSEHANSPHDCDGTSWRVAWPDVGGGGDENLELDEEELFLRMYAWDQTNYIVAAGTSGTSDKNSTGGVVDNHAYSVITSVDNVAGTDIDLIKVRNPWGKGEIEDGEFDDDGPGWDKYPQIKAELKPVVADDGIFWVTKKEFFQFFKTIYLCASDMTEYLED